MLQSLEFDKVIKNIADEKKQAQATIKDAMDLSIERHPFDLSMSLD